MKIPVHMFAFYNRKDVVRIVDVPDKVIEAAEERDILELVFQYGQNDFQPLPLPSVSVGDVIELNSRYYMVISVGFQILSTEEFNNLTPPTSIYAYQKSIKDVLKEDKK